jgi:hypothetical protein
VAEHCRNVFEEDRVGVKLIGSRILKKETALAQLRSGGFSEFLDGALLVDGHLIAGVDAKGIRIEKDDRVAASLPGPEPVHSHRFYGEDNRRRWTIMVVPPVFLDVPDAPWISDAEDGGSLEKAAGRVRETFHEEFAPRVPMEVVAKEFEEAVLFF